ncbi:hypothetical protein PHLCEN_2v12904 [Hermanssonia centrifuga]|uniref:Uncharacterized protein n=1 Tax=Hermanssonia centrifuga TaxID=98765 RepID=A0A2R6NFU6_9APHY|nr:hypothetical protein PHLCEN_2v12904 [Hermanssonia centrifuga]
MIAVGPGAGIPRVPEPRLGQSCLGMFASHAGMQQAPRHADKLFTRRTHRTLKIRQGGE